MWGPRHVSPFEGSQLSVYLGRRALRGTSSRVDLWVPFLAQPSASGLSTEAGREHLHLHDRHRRARCFWNKAPSVHFARILHVTVAEKLPRSTKPKRAECPSGANVLNQSEFLRIKAHFPKVLVSLPSGLWQLSVPRGCPTLEGVPTPLSGCGVGEFSRWRRAQNDEMSFLRRLIGTTLRMGRPRDSEGETV